MNVGEGARILFSGFSDEQGGNNDGSRKNYYCCCYYYYDDYYHYQRLQRQQRGIVLKTFRKGTSHFQITPSDCWRTLALALAVAIAPGGRGWMERAHFNQALIELKTRILLQDPQTPKFHGTAAMAPTLPTDAILQVLRA